MVRTLVILNTEVSGILPVSVYLGPTMGSTSYDIYTMGPGVQDMMHMVYVCSRCTW